MNCLQAAGGRADARTTITALDALDAVLGAGVGAAGESGSGSATGSRIELHKRLVALAEAQESAAAALRALDAAGARLAERRAAAGAAAAAALDARLEVATAALRPHRAALHARARALEGAAECYAGLLLRGGGGGAHNNNAADAFEREQRAEADATYANVAAGHAGGDGSSASGGRKEEEAARAALIEQLLESIALPGVSGTQVLRASSSSNSNGSGAPRATDLTADASRAASLARALAGLARGLAELARSISSGSVEGVEVLEVGAAEERGAADAETEQAAKDAWAAFEQVHAALLAKRGQPSSSNSSSGAEGDSDSDISTDDDDVSRERRLTADVARAGTAALRDALRAPLGGGAAANGSPRAAARSPGKKGKRDRAARELQLRRAYQDLVARMAAQHARALAAAAAATAAAGSANAVEAPQQDAVELVGAAVAAAAPAAADAEETTGELAALRARVAAMAAERQRQAALLAAVASDALAAARAHAGEVARLKAELAGAAAAKTAAAATSAAGGVADPTAADPAPLIAAAPPSPVRPPHDPAPLRLLAEQFGVAGAWRDGAAATSSSTPSVRSPQPKQQQQQQQQYHESFYAKHPAKALALAVLGGRAGTGGSTGGIASLPRQRVVRFADVPPSPRRHSPPPRFSAAAAAVTNSGGGGLRSNAVTAAPAGPREATTRKLDRLLGLPAADDEGCEGKGNPASARAGRPQAAASPGMRPSSSGRVTAAPARLSASRDAAIRLRRPAAAVVKSK